MSANADGPGIPSEQQAGAKQNGFDTPAVLTIAAAHLGHDMYSGFLAPLLPLLIAKLSMPLTLAGLLPSVFRAGSLAQPFLGAWADRSDSRYFVILTPTVTALCMSFLGMAPDYLSLVLLLGAAGLSHASFHPAAASSVTRASGDTWGKGTSLHMVGGKIGFALGPLFIVAIVTWVGMENSYIAALPGVLFSLLLYLQLKGRGAPPVTVKSRGAIWKAITEQRQSLLLLSGFVLFRSTASVSFSTFYPTFLTDRGQSLLFAGFSMTVFQIGGAAGALVGGTVSDHMGRRGMLVVSQLLAGPLLFLSLYWPDGPVGLVLLGLAGAMVSSATPVQLALFQELMPGARSTAAGLWALLSYEGSLATALIVGVIGDMVGLAPALGLSVLATMFSIPFILAIPEPERVR